MKLSNPTKSPTMPARSWKPAALTRAAYQQAEGGSMEFTARLDNGLHVHVTLSDAELDALVEHRQKSRLRVQSAVAGADERTWQGTSFYDIHDNPVPGAPA